MYHLIVCGFPSLLGIFLFEFLNAQILFYTETTVSYFYVIARFFHVIPSFSFAYLADKNYRKEALLMSHVLGFIASFLLYLYGFSFWSVLVVSIVFNPLSVARAALLDNFPRYSPLKLMAVAFIMKGIPWVVFCVLYQNGFSFSYLIKVTLSLFLLNVLMIAFLFRDNRDAFGRSHGTQFAHIFRGVGSQVVSILIAFILMQAIIRMAWERIEFIQLDQMSWTAFAHIGLILGSASAMLYKRLPHLSIITLTYVAGVCFIILTILLHRFSPVDHSNSIATVVCYYCVIGGISLPLVADVVITLFGSHRKALGAVMIDVAEAMSLLVAVLLATLVISSFYQTASVMLLLFLVASVLQKQIERRA